MVERVLQAELAAHLDDGKHEPVKHPAGNTHNGKSKKMLKSEFGELPIEIPRDGHGSFELQSPKHQTNSLLNFSLKRSFEGFYAEAGLHN